MRSIVAMLLVSTMLYVTPLFAGEGDAAAGKDLFGKKCASCHGASGEGKDSVAKALKVEIHHLGSKEVQTKSDADLKKVIVEGTGKMKGLKDIDAKGADDVLAYMRTFAKK
jgi:mono/diheme cytochrome c family protein